MQPTTFRTKDIPLNDKYGMDFGTHANPKESKDLIEG
jgi:hypothetical protein